MNKLFVTTVNGNNIASIPAGQTAEQVAASFGITDPSLYQEFPESDFEPACYNFPSAFTLTDGVVSFDLDTAKQIGDILINQQSNEAAAKVMAGLSYDVYVAQSTLPPEQRIAKYQAAIDANNAIAIETENREQALYAASTIQEVNAIVYPPKGEAA